MKSRIELSEHFTFKKIIRFTLPSVLGMVFTSIYGIVDGFFVSNFAGSHSFAAVNLIIPFITILSPVGFMFGTGGSALISKHLGMNQAKKANEIFSLLIYLLIGTGVVVGVAGFFLVKPVALLLGSTQEMLGYCVTYGRINMIGLVFYMLQYAFEILLVTAERPKMAMGVTLAAGITNMALDGLFMGVLGLGVAGAAWATVISQIVGSVVPLLFFIFTKTSKIRLGSTKWDGKSVWLSCTNGASELMTNISSAVVGMIYNFQLMRIAGENGVASYGVISAALTAISEIFAGALSSIFVGYDAEVLSMTTAGFRIFSVSFLMMGFNTFISSFFTALNNGKVSALLSFGRTFVFQVICVIALPALFGLDGIWTSVIAAEILGLFLSIACVWKYRKVYHYLAEKN